MDSDCIEECVEECERRGGPKTELQKILILKTWLENQKDTMNKWAQRQEAKVRKKHTVSTPSREGSF